MDSLRRFNEEVQKLDRVLQHYHAGRVRTIFEPDFADKRKICYGAVFMENHIGDYMGDLFLYASEQAKQRGIEDSILLVLEEKAKRCTLTIKPDLNQASSRQDREPLVEQTERFLNRLIHGIKAYEEYQKKRWVKINPN